MNESASGLIAPGAIAGWLPLGEDLAGRLALALGIGLLIGLERGWHDRNLDDGGRVAGIRTFGLIGLLGGVWATLARTLDDRVLAAALLVFGIAVTAAHVMRVRRLGDLGATTLVASLLTFGLGAMAVRVDMALAASAAVIVTLLLGMKTALHGWVRRIEYVELVAVLQLLLISVVMLPVLPDRGFGPWQALNPREIWWMVVLIAGISFVGYVAVRYAGTRRGMLITAIAGGLASSTVVTLNFARLSKRNPELARVLAAGAAAATLTLFARVVVIVAAVNPRLSADVAMLLAPGAAVSALGGLILWPYRQKSELPETIAVRNPFEFWTAFRFGLLLTGVLLAGRALQNWYGAGGLYATAAIAGLADVDAVTLSMSRLAGDIAGPFAVSAATARIAILIAVAVNTIAKAAIAVAFGADGFRWRVAAALVGVAAALAGSLAFDA